MFYSWVNTMEMEMHEQAQFVNYISPQSEPGFHECVIFGQGISE
jgi:hypothetical protein